MLIYIITNYGRVYKKNKRKEHKIPENNTFFKVLEKEQNQLNKHVNILEIHLGLLTSNAETVAERNKKRYLSKPVQKNVHNKEMQLKTLIKNIKTSPNQTKQKQCCEKNMVELSVLSRCLRIQTHLCIYSLEVWFVKISRWEKYGSGEEIFSRKQVSQV